MRFSPVDAVMRMRERFRMRGRLASDDRPQDGSHRSSATRKKFFLWVTLCAWLLICMLVLNILGMKSALPSRAIRIVSGSLLLFITIGTLWGTPVWCARPEVKRQPSVLKCVWVRLPLDDVLLWQQCGKDDKPCVNFEVHHLHPSNAQAACPERPQVPETAAQATTQESSDNYCVINLAPSADLAVDCSDQPMFEEGLCCPNLDVQMKSPQSHDDAFDTSTNASTSLCCVCCLEDFYSGESVAMLRCGHAFHEACIQSWMLKATVPCCPLCKTSALEQ